MSIVAEDFSMFQNMTLISARRYNINLNYFKCKLTIDEEIK